MEDKNAVRLWAQMSGLVTGNRGTLRAPVIAAYKTAHQDSARPGIEWLGRFDVLATYLKPRFGNIYDYEDSPAWSTRIYHAVRTFLVHEMQLHLLGKMAGEGKPIDAGVSLRKDLADSVIDSGSVWEIAVFVHDAVVSNIPDLRRLYSKLHLGEVWPGEGERFDVCIWLEQHANLRLLEHVAMRITRDSHTHPHWALELADELSPPELLAAWEAMMSSSSEDISC